jgi:pyruvate,water dikinase
MPLVVTFDAPDAQSHNLVGGKARNLGRMTAAGFVVPAGFTVTTEAHSLFLSGGVLEEVLVLAGGIDYADPDDVRTVSEKIRGVIASSPMSQDIADAIRHAYAALDGEAFVAVRSSGTAEDLSGASFAGLHDTYLDVRGAEDVVTAVKTCWASLFTDRATSYRHDRGFAHAEARMGVVVQRMVSSESSGVLFTGNPLTEANDELVINSSWGLGEAVVQGIVTPDQITVKACNLALIDVQVGHKTVQLVRNPDGKGAVEIDVPEERRGQLSLCDGTIRELARLGLSVQQSYGGLPQDIEWALEGGQLYLLQARPITGVNFAWDCDVDHFQKEDEAPGTVWSRVLADEVWTGAITPLMYSHRAACCWVFAYRDAAGPVLQDTELASARMMKYHKGEAYVNVVAERAMMRWAHPAARPGMAVRLPEDMQSEALAQPFSLWKYAQALLRARVVYGKIGTPNGWMRYLDDCEQNRVQEAEGLPVEELPNLSDPALKRYIQKQSDFEGAYDAALIWPGLLMYVRDAVTALAAMLSQWYDGEAQPMSALSQLMTGTESVTWTMREHVDLYDMSRMLRASETLTRDLAEHRDQAFFDALAETEEGRSLRRKLDEFLAVSGHRGHADRDIYYPRYLDDPGVLYRALEAHAKSDSDPREMHDANNSRRNALAAEIEANLRRKPLGALKAEAFKVVLHYIQRFLEYRDNERHYVDRNTYSIRNACLEVNRRVRERGRLDSDRDFWFLTLQELYTVLDGTYNPELIAAKVLGRMTNFDRFDTREWQPPKFLQNNKTLLTEAALGAGHGALQGIPTSSGIVTGTARVVKQLSQISRVNAGEILVANSTDPGWTPVFAVLAGVIVETGGMLSHSSCLAREYGFPAAQIEGAMHLVPDGATITLDGDTGRVTIVSADLAGAGTDVECDLVQTAQPVEAFNA